MKNYKHKYKVKESLINAKSITNNEKKVFNCINNKVGIKKM